MGNDNCKNNPQHPEYLDFGAPDTDIFSEITIPLGTEIHLTITPAQAKMEKLAADLAGICAEIHGLPALWGETLEYHRRRKGLTVAELSRRTHISETTIHKFRSNPHIQPRVTVVLAVIVGLNLHPLYAYDLLSKASYNIANPTLVNFIYRYLINYCHNATIEVWNRRLKESGLDIVLPGPNFFDPLK